MKTTLQLIEKEQFKNSVGRQTRSFSLPSFSAMHRLNFKTRNERGLYGVVGRKSTTLNKTHRTPEGGEKTPTSQLKGHIYSNGKSKNKSLENDWGGGKKRGEAFIWTNLTHKNYR